MEKDKYMTGCRPSEIGFVFHGVKILDTGCWIKEGLSNFRHFSSL
jgi:hypothetical protein